MAQQIVLWDKNKIAFDLVEKPEDQQTIVQFLCGESASQLLGVMHEREIAFTVQDDVIEMYFKFNGELHLLNTTN